MPQQAGNLLFCGLGVDGPCQPAGAKPALPDGIHLRWGFPFERDFPWGGFFLFRRKAQPITANGSIKPGSGSASGGGPDGAPAGGGWSTVPGLPQSGPILLPVVSNSLAVPSWWPRIGGDARDGGDRENERDRENGPSDGTAGDQAPSPAAAKQAWLDAAKRIQFGNANDERPGFDELHALLAQLVAGGPGSGAMGGLYLPPTTTETADGMQVAIAPPRPTDADVLRLILLRTIEPAYAQLLGLYWVDTATQPGQLWDYALLADRQAAFAGNVKAALDWLNAEPRPQMDIDVAWLLGMERKPASPLSVHPDRVRAFALPIPTRAVEGGSAANVDTPPMTVGLRWLAPEVPDVVGIEATGAGAAGTLAWRIERAHVDSGALPVPAEPVKDTKLADPQGLWTQAHEYATMLVPPALTEKWPGVWDEDTPEGWPTFALGFVDKPLAEGWYAYRVTATDLFGRQSPPSLPAQWRYWTTWTAQVKPPWYAQEPWTPGFPGNQMVVHNSAVGLYDKQPPPPPIGLWAEVVDPEDPFAVQDAGWLAAKKMLAKDEVGLRLRWQWTLAQQRQAPDACAFRVYLRGGVANTRFGQVTAVDAGSRPLVVHTDLPQPANAQGSYTGAVLRINGRGLQIAVASVTQAGMLTFELALPSGLTDAAAAEARIRPGLRCGLVLAKDTQPGWIDAQDVEKNGWVRRLVVDIGWSTKGGPGLALLPVRLARADLTEQDPLQADLLVGSHAKVVDTTVEFDGTQPFDGIDVTLHVLVLWAEVADDKGYPNCKDLSKAVILPFTLVDKANRSVRVAEGDLAKVPASWKSGSGDPAHHVRWAIGDLVKHFDAAIPLAGSGLLPEPSVTEGKTYLQFQVTTADDRAHTADWLKEGGVADPFGWGGIAGNEGEAAALQTVFRVRRQEPQPPKPLWPDPPQASEHDGDGRSFFTVRWEKGAGAAVRIYRGAADAVFQADFKQRKPNETGDAVGKWMFAQVEAGKAEPLAFAGARKAYEDLSSKQKQDIASAQHVAVAFSAVHAAPLAVAACPDTKGPDLASDKGELKPDSVCAYVDVLPGRVPGLYFYRMQAVDAAGNVSDLALSAASPPVKVPEVFVPSAPVIVEAYAGTPEMRVELAALREAQEKWEQDKSKPKPKPEWEVTEKYAGMVTLVWSVPAVEKEKIAGWNVYRTADPAKAGAVGLMELVPGKKVQWKGEWLPGAWTVAGDMAGAASCSWTGVVGPGVAWYCVVACAVGQRCSAASVVVGVGAFASAVGKVGT